jgi:hypothetical protein
MSLSDFAKIAGIAAVVFILGRLGVWPGLNNGLLIVTDGVAIGAFAMGVAILWETRS